MSFRTVAGMAACVLAVGLCAACSSPFGKKYEYEEDLYLSADGSGELIVNTSIAALVALRGAQLDTDPQARVDSDAISTLYASPDAEVRPIRRPWRRGGRRFVQVRIRVDDVRKLGGIEPLSWSRYELVTRDAERLFTQTVGASALKPGTLKDVGWKGGELVAFRLHAPSRIISHNARDIETGETLEVQRGNILAWEQALTDRLDGRPVSIEVRMTTGSILHQTLWLFAGAFLAALLLVATLIWLARRKGTREAAVARKGAA